MDEIARVVHRLLLAQPMKKPTKLDLSKNALSLRTTVLRELQPQDYAMVVGGGNTDIRVVTSLPGKHC